VGLGDEYQVAVLLDEDWILGLQPAAVHAPRLSLKPGKKYVVRVAAMLAEEGKPPNVRAVSNRVETEILPEPADEPTIPFPHAMEHEPDPEVARLVSIWSSNWTSPAARDAQKAIVSMGSDAVPSLIIILKRAANTEPFIIGKPRRPSDIRRGELRAALIDLQEIADRRALPALSALMKYDNKPRRFGGALKTILLHGSDEQLQRDATSPDPNIARIAQLILDNPERYDYRRKEYQEEERARRSGGRFSPKESPEPSGATPEPSEDGG